jgi:sulfate/thiosulfate transport system permease protein
VAASAASRYSLRTIALVYLAALVLAPVGMVLYRALEPGLEPLWASLTDPRALHALKLTAIAAAIAVPLNTIFGVACALLLARRNFRGKSIIETFVDMPFAISPVVVGLALLLVYGRDGWFGETLLANGIQVLFTPTAIVIATVFVSLPFVVREVLPVLHEIGTEQEKAAETLGASGRQIFWRITLPSIRWAVGYGVVLTTARSLGEFGAVAIVSGRLSGGTETLTILVDSRYQTFDAGGAYAAALTLAVLSILTLAAMIGAGRRKRRLA